MLANDKEKQLNGFRFNPLVKPNAITSNTGLKINHTDDSLKVRRTLFNKGREEKWGRGKRKEGGGGERERRGADEYIYGVLTPAHTGWITWSHPH
jgi:hypothetical protein